MIDQWAPIDVRQFRPTWPLGPQTAVSPDGHAEPVLRMLRQQQMDTKQLGAKHYEPEGPGDVEPGKREQQLPLTDDEIEKMYETCQRDGKTGKHNGMATMLPISSALAGFSGGMSGSRTRELLY